MIAPTKIIYHGVPAATVPASLSAPAKLSVDITNTAGSFVLLVPDFGSKVYKKVAINSSD